MYILILLYLNNQYHNSFPFAFRITYKVEYLTHHHDNEPNPPHGIL